MEAKRFKEPQLPIQRLRRVECKTIFPVQKNDLPSLVEALHIPTTFNYQQLSVCDGMDLYGAEENLSSYPCRYRDTILCFAKPVPVLSMITNTVVDFIYDMHGHRIMQWGTTSFVTPTKAGTVRSCGCREGGSIG